jgi:Holliday junction resolvase
MLESAVQSKIIKWLESEGHYVVRVLTSSKAGTPDLIVCAHGRFVALEVKRPSGGVVSPLQKHHIEKIQKAGGIAGVVRSVDDVIELLTTSGPTLE